MSPPWIPDQIYREDILQSDRQASDFLQQDFAISAFKTSSSFNLKHPKK